MMNRALDIGRCIAEAVGRFFARLEENTVLRGVLFAGILLLIAAVMFTLNSRTPLMMDDYDYSFSMHNGERIDSLLDVIPSQAAHYMIWGGRSVVHAIAQAFLRFDKVIFNVANTFMYLLLLLELYAIAAPAGRRFNWTLLMTAHLFLFFFVPFFGTVFLWLDGACNYLWGTALALCPILLHKSARELGFFSHGKVQSVIAVLACFLAGWTNENTACGVFAVVFLMVVMTRMKGERVARWQWSALAAQLLGIAVMLLAPGNFARAQTVSSRSLIMELVYRFAVVTVYACVYAGGLLVAVLFFFSLSRKMQIPMRMGRTALLLLGALLTAYALIGSPLISDRSYTGVLALALCALLVIQGDFEARVRLFDAQKIVALPLLLLIIAHGGYKAAQQVADHEAAWLIQAQRIEEAKENGEERVSIDSIPSHSPYTFSISLEDDPSLWPNSTLSKYFGLEITSEK